MAITTIAGLVRAHGATRPDRPAVTTSTRTATFAELDARSNQVAQALAAEGVAAGDRVAYLDKNALEYFELLFGAAKLNAVTVGVSWRLAPPEIAAIVNDSRATVFVVGEEFVPTVAAIESQLESVEKIVVVGSHERHQSFEQWVDGQPAVDPDVPSGPDDVALQLYTSGTTGVPKGAMITNGNLFALVAAAPVFGLDANSVNLVPMPLFHIGGSGYACLGMFAGAHTVLMREANPAEVLRLLVEQQVTNTFVVPAVLQFMLSVPGIDELDFSALRCVSYGASPISTEVLSTSIKTFKCDFIQVYGLTETTGTVTMLLADDHDVDGPKAHRLRSAGRPAPGAELRIVSTETGEVAPIGAVGEVCVRSPGNMAGYWNKPDETASTLTADGWLRTGDAGYLDADGYLYIHDRVKDLIISGAENVYPAEVENVLMSHPGVADVAAIGVPSERWGETVKAIVVKAPDADPSPEEIIIFARERLAHYKCPTSVDFIDVLPRNASGKILKRELRAPYWAGHERSVN
jgi:long-chain acyl-CoA synthetase